MQHTSCTFEEKIPHHHHKAGGYRVHSNTQWAPTFQQAQLVLSDSNNVNSVARKIKMVQELRGWYLVLW